MPISENMFNSAYAELCLQPPHASQGLSTTPDRSQRVSECRGDVWVTTAAFSSDHAVTHQFFYCISCVLCLSMKERNKCLVLCSMHAGWQVSPGLWPSPVPGCSFSLWTHQSPQWPSRADCTCRKTGFSLQFSLAYPDYHAYYHHGIWMPSRKTARDKVSVCLPWVSLSLPLSLIYTISLYISQKIPPFLEATVL